jgi:ribosomal protein L37AE/L43A
MVAKAESGSLHGAIPATEPWHLVRRIILLLLLVVATALGLSILLSKYGTVAKALFSILADCGIGLVTGLGSRLVIRPRNWLIRAVASGSLAVVGLVTLGYLTENQIGIGPMEFELHGMNWLQRAAVPWWARILPEQSSTDLIDAANLVIAVDVSWVSLRAWHRERRSVGTDSSALSLPNTASPPIGARKLHKQSPREHRATSAARGNQRLTARRRKPRSMSYKWRAGARGPLPKPRRLARLRRTAVVRLGLREKHRCPYCLDDVRRGDERGIVECPVCHALHHKDCWDITGTCQVLHQNA